MNLVANKSASLPYFALDLWQAAHGQLAVVILLGVLFVASCTDLQSRRIPNWLTLPTVVLGWGLGCVWYGLPGLSASLLGSVLWFVLGFGFYQKVGGIGAGDVKLVMAGAALLGCLPALQLTFIGLAMQVVWLIVRWGFQGNLASNLRALGSWLYMILTPGSVKTHFHPAGDVDQTPFAPFLLLSTALAVTLRMF